MIYHRSNLFTDGDPFILASSPIEQNEPKAEWRRGEKTLS